MGRWTPCVHFMAIQGSNVTTVDVHKNDSGSQQKVDFMQHLLLEEERSDAAFLGRFWYQCLKWGKVEVLKSLAVENSCKNSLSDK